MNFFDELKWRGLIKDSTDLEGVKEKINGKTTVYMGFDPTADSLHIGHMQQLILLGRYQKAGHRVISLCGGATGMIGDPRPTSERKLLSFEETLKNIESIKKQMNKIIDFSDEKKGLLLNNYDWTKNISLISFLRDYGKHFNVSYMINKDIVAKRLETGISYTEFTYTILQALDFLHLYDNYGCDLQIGGSDQWGNIVSGNDLIKKIHGDKAKVYGVTTPLITKKDGSKFGKSEGGNIWLDPLKTSPYEFYQFWINVADEDCINFLKRLSFKTKEEIEELEISLNENPNLRLAQKALAKELTILIHGEKEYEKAIKITETLFKGNIFDLTVEEIKEGLKDAPSKEILDGANILDVLCELGVCNSKSEARKLIQGNSISVDGKKVSSFDFEFKKSDAINNELSIIKKGKKYYFVAKFK